MHAVTAGGRERELFRVAPRAGKRLRVTLDQRLQILAERLLADVGPASALVAVRPSTGAIVAAANGPGTDGYNTATYGQIAPGSTFKSVSSLALLRAGLTPGDRGALHAVDRGRRQAVRELRRLPAPARLGRIPLRTALANSCNTAFISQRGRLHDGDLADAAASLGMGIDHDLGFPAYFGSVAPPASRDRGGGRPDRPGHRAGLADGDGDRDRLGPGRPRSWCRGWSSSADVSVPDEAPPLSRQEAGRAARPAARASSPPAAGAGCSTSPARR